MKARQVMSSKLENIVSSDTTKKKENYIGIK